MANFKRIKWTDKMVFDGGVLRGGVGEFMGSRFAITGITYKGGPKVTVTIEDGPLSGRVWESFPPCGSLRSTVSDALRQMKIEVYTEVVGNHPMHDNIG